mgnify:CR=1 FL=1
MRMKQKKNIFFEEKKNQNGLFFKMAVFQNRQFLRFFLRKFYRLVLVLVGLIDAKSFNVAQPIWS